MTQRFRYDTFWASGGVSVDPDTDTEHPIYVADRYATTGWKAEKPPNEWDNYLYQITDAKILWLLQEGIPSWDETVSYAVGSVTRVGEVLYKNISSSPALNQPPEETDSVWLPIIGIDGASFSAAVKSLQDALSQHLAADNPHQDNITDIGGYLSADVFKMFDDDTDPKTIKYHKKQRGKVHSETVQQLGTLPTSGGTFAGDVTFLQKIYFDEAKTIYLRLNKSTARAEIHVGGFTLAVDTVGNIYFNDGSTDYLVATVANFNRLTMAVNPKFALPQPLVVIDVNDGYLSFVGNYPVTLTTTADAVWESGKGLVLSNSNLTGDTINFTGTKTSAYIVGYNSSGRTSEIYDYDDSNYNSLGLFLVNTTKSKFTHLQKISIYPRLTAYQKSTLVNYATS